ncbi:DUF1611 domain-containing protein [Streptomyces sp. AC555_RSS877]|uniref:DUF1611 domain-containing protein n=1 Tax=Streptomyces sp. AC555_RSS877 TaxID=2823688 RepID=UPI001C27AB88|nr:DUF1611 domain-containing protein [Streptomyces sp. AC555_RSS877]
MRPLVIYTGTSLGDADMAKTAYGIVRFAPERVHSVWDTKHGGARAQDIVPAVTCDAPVVATLDDVPDEYDLVIGFAPIGGGLTERQYADLASAAGPGVRIINGLHQELELPGVVNLRHLRTGERPIAQGHPLASYRILTVGTSHAVGKMTATCQLYNGLRQHRGKVEWLATGQTGMLIAGQGRVLDSIPVDFVPGHIEQMLMDVDSTGKVVIVEGQGSIFHPSYSGLAASLFHTVAPQAYVLCARVGQEKHLGFDWQVPSVPQAIEAYDRLATVFGIDSSCIAVSLDSTRVSEEEYLAEKEKLSAITGLPVADPVREGADTLLTAEVMARLPEQP